MENQETQGLSEPSVADSPKTVLDATTLEIAMLGYDKAIDLWAAASEDRMSKYNAMLVANSLILAAIGFSYQTINFYTPIKYFLPIVGIVICAVWYMSGKRAIEMIILWNYCARELEKNFFSHVFNHKYRGYLFGGGTKLEFLVDKPRFRKMKFWGRQFKNQTLLNFIILIFAIMYITVLVLEII